MAEIAQEKMAVFKGEIHLQKSYRRHYQRGREKRVVQFDVSNVDKMLSKMKSGEQPLGLARRGSSVTSAIRLDAVLRRKADGSGLKREWEASQGDSE